MLPAFSAVCCVNAPFMPILLFTKLPAVEIVTLFAILVRPASKCTSAPLAVMFWLILTVVKPLRPSVSEPLASRLSAVFTFSVSTSCKSIWLNPCARKPVPMLETKLSSPAITSSKAKPLDSRCIERTRSRLRALASNEAPSGTCCESNCCWLTLVLPSKVPSSTSFCT